MEKMCRKEGDLLNSNTDPGRETVDRLHMGKPPGRFGNRKWWIAAAVLLAVAVTVFFVVGKMRQPAESTQYKTQEVQRGALTVTVTATGTLKATNSVDVGSELSGIIKTVSVTYNNRVRVGQALAMLDTKKLEAQVKQSKASLEAAKAKVLQCQATVRESQAKLRQMQRVRELSNGKVPSQAEWDAQEAVVARAMADEASAKASVLQSLASLDADETNLYKAVIRSPINGVVLTRSVEPGQTVAAAYQAPTLFTLAEDLTKMELHVNVDEADIGKVKAGQNALFTVAAYPNRTFGARIIQARFGSTTTSGVVTYETVLAVDNSDMALRPGMTATAEITTQRIENAVLIPNAALRFTPPVQEAKRASVGLVGSLLPRPPSRPAAQQGKDKTAKKQQQVWTLKGGQPVAIPVTVGATNGIVTEVVAGDVKPGTALVTDAVEKRS